MILLIAGQKGGGGKTTTAVGLAFERKRQGRDVLLVDGDFQKSATKWAMRRAELGADVRVPCIALYGRTLADEVRGLSKKYEDIVIDVGGHKSEEFLSAMTVANRLITPVRASQFDLDTMVEVDALVQMIKAINGALDATWFVNMAPTNPASKVSALNGAMVSLEDLHNLRPLDTHICNRTAFELIGSGITISEAPKSNSQEKGVRELMRLFAEAWDE